MLVVAGPNCIAAGEIAKQLGLSPSSLSFRLKDLSHADLAKPRQESRFIIDTANFDAITGLIGFVTENCCAGAACATREFPTATEIHHEAHADSCRGTRPPFSGQFRENPVNQASSYPLSVATRFAPELGRRLAVDQKI
jgi:ArsR family transcriptional regulator